MKYGWYIGSYKGRHGIHEECYGWLVTGYWSGERYSHTYWGLVWAGRWTFGVGRIVKEEI